jgi:hypothetical protein
VDLNRIWVEAWLKNVRLRCEVCKQTKFVEKEAVRSDRLFTMIEKHECGKDGF